MMLITSLELVLIFIIDWFMSLRSRSPCLALPMKSSVLICVFLTLSPMVSMILVSSLTRWTMALRLRFSSLTRSDMLVKPAVSCFTVAMISSADVAWVLALSEKALVEEDISSDETKSSWDRDIVLLTTSLIFAMKRLNHTPRLCIWFSVFTL